MPSIRILQFGGIRPAVEPRLLPLPNAQVAHNTELRRGDLCPYEVPVDVGECDASHIFLASVFENSPQLMCEAGCMVQPYRSCLSEHEVAVFYPDRAPEVIDEDGSRPLLPPAPPTAPVPTLVADGPVKELTGVDARFYLVTWVNEDGVESRPSPPSEVISVRDGAVVDLALPPPPPGTLYMRVYRNDSPADSGMDEGSVESTPQLISEVAPQATFRDNRRLMDMEQGGLTTLDNCDPPPLECVAETEAGYLVGFNGGEVAFSEIGEPHNWPERYRFTLPYDIVGIAVHQNDVYVGTTGHPYRISIAQPDGEDIFMQYDITRYDDFFPLLHQEAITATDAGAAMATIGGVATLSRQGAVLATRDRIDEDIWDDEIAPTMLEWQHGRLFGYGGPIGGFILGWQGASNLDIGDLVTIDWQPDTIHAGYDGKMYYVQDGSARTWDEGKVNLPYRWVSRIYRAQGWMKWAAAKVVGDHDAANPVTFRLYSENGLYWEQQVVNNKPFRLPCGPRGIEWWVELEGTTCVREAHVATSKMELTEIGGGTDG
ncbi:MAG: hypothetical protein ACK5MY_02515 [Jhaorihella sp.]